MGEFKELQSEELVYAAIDGGIGRVLPTFANQA